MIRPQRSSLSPVSLGLLAGWLATVFAPIGASNTVERLQELGTPAVLARAAFFVCLAATTLALALCLRLSRTNERKSCGGRCLARLSALTVAATLACALAGIANWALNLAGWQSAAVPALAFALTGVTVPLLQVDLLRRVRLPHDMGIRRAVPIVGIAILSFLACAFTVGSLRQPIGSLLPVAALACGRLAAHDDEANDGPNPHAPLFKPAATVPCTALFLALAACHVFNGSAELGFFVHPLAMTAGVVLGMVAAAGIVVTPPHARQMTQLAVGVSLVILLVIAAQGALSLCGAGDRVMSGALGSVMHVAVFVGEYALVGLALAGFGTAAAEGSAAEQPTLGALAAVNAGIAAGSLTGMVVGGGAAATMASLALSLGALLLLGVQLGSQKTGETRSRAYTAQDPEEIRAANLDAFGASHGLSERECEVLALWATGHQVDYVAQKLCISKNTVRTHVQHIYRKTGAANREELLLQIEANR